MKKRFIIFILIFLVGVLMGYSKSMRIVNPSTPVIWKIGSTHIIEWSAIGVKGRVFLQLLQGDTVMGEIYKGPDNGIFSWEIKNFVDGTPIPEGTYMLKVVSKRFSDVFDERKIILTNSPKIYIVDPENPVSWKIGETHSIGWLSGGVDGGIKIELYENGKSEGVIYDGNNMGVFLWNIKTFSDGKEIKKGAYMLRVSSKVNPMIYHEVPVNLSFSSKCRLELISPPKNFKIPVFIGGKLKILWKAVNCNVNTVSISVYRIKGDLCSDTNLSSQPVFTKKIEDKNVFIWNVTGNLTPGLYKVILKKGDNQVSSSCFKIGDKKSVKHIIKRER